MAVWYVVGFCCLGAFMTIGFLVFCCCVVGARADEQMERMVKDMVRRKEAGMPPELNPRVIAINELRGQLAATQHLSDDDFAYVLKELVEHVEELREERGIAYVDVFGGVG